MYTGDREQLRQRNINVAYNPATGRTIPLPTSPVAPSVLRRGATSSLNRPDNRANYHALQVAFMKRMGDRWQASATYTSSRTRVFDQLPLNPGCQYPVTYGRRVRIHVRRADHAGP